MQTYIERVRTGQTQLSEETLDDFIDEWHSANGWRNFELHTAIGLSKEGFEKFLKVGLLDTVAQELSTKS